MNTLVLFYEKRIKNKISISVSTLITITTVAVALRTNLYTYYLKRNMYVPRLVQKAVKRKNHGH